MMSVFGSCMAVAGLGGSSGQLVVAVRTPARANWQNLVQHQVNRRTVIKKKWLTLIDEACRVRVGGHECKEMLAVEILSATTSKTSSALNQSITAFKFAAHSTSSSPDQPNQKAHTLFAQEIPPSIVKLQPIKQYGQNEPYQEVKRVPTAQYFKGEDLFDIQVVNVSRELPLNPVALANFLLVFLSIQVLNEMLKEDASEEAILEMICIISCLFLFVKQMEGANHLSPNLLQKSMQIATSKQFPLLCFIVFMGQVSAAHAGGATHEGTKQSGSAADGNVWEKLRIKAAAFTLASVIIGGAVWSMLRWLTRGPKFEVDEGLRKSPIPRKSDPNSVLHPVQNFSDEHLMW